MPDFTVEDQIKNLSDDQLRQMIAHMEQIKRDNPEQNMGSRISKSLLSGAEGMLLASQGRPFSDVSKPEQQVPQKPALTPDQELDFFEKKERIKAKIKQEFGGSSGGLQVVQLPGGGFAVVPGGAATQEGVAKELSQQTDAQGNPLELEDITISRGGVKGKLPKTEQQREREAIEGGVKKGVEEAFKQAEGLKRAVKKIGSITRQFNEALPSGEATATEQRISGLISVFGAQTGLKPNPKLLALQRTAKLQLRAILRDMGEGARLSDQDISQNIALIEQAGLTNDEREALISTYMQTDHSVFD